MRLATKKRLERGNVGLNHPSMDSLVRMKGMAFFVSRAVFFKIRKARVGSETPANEPKESKGTKK